MRDIFTTQEYDNKILVISDGKEYTLHEIKEMIAYEMEYLKTKKENIVILSGDNFSFIIRFFASIFCKKNIYLITDSKKTELINFEYDLPEDHDFGRCEFKIPEIDIKFPSINFYTSGSTSKPKIIQKSLYNLIREAEDIGKEFNLEGKNIFSTTTMCHLFGCTFHLMYALYNGLKICTDKISYPENMTDKNSVLVSTPAFLSAVFKHNLSFGKNPDYIISAGSKLDEKTFEKLENFSKIIEIYGSTETGVIAHKTHFSDDFILFENVQIENKNTIKSDYMYEDSIEINDNIEVSNRNIKIKNRTDRLFKIQEKRVSAEELEMRLKEHEFVEMSYILKTDDKLACLTALSEAGQDFVLKNGVGELTKNLKQQLFRFSEIVPQRWKYIDTIPMNEMGKINKPLIEKIFSVNLSLPIILSREIGENSVTYKIFFYRNCNFFNGHFPDFKLVPGVVQLYLAKELANAHFKLNLGTGQWKRIKFSNIIKPDSIIFLKLKKNEQQVSYEYSSGTKTYACGVFLCKNIFKDVI